MFRSIIYSQISVLLILCFFQQIQAQDYPEVDLEFRTSFQIQTQDAEYDAKTPKFKDGKEPVSYTHLPLPTIYSV